MSMAVGLALLASTSARLRRGRAEHLQLGQLHQPRPDQEVRGEIQRQGHDHRLRLQRHRARQGRAGGHGFDIVVPSQNYVPIWIKEGLLLETRPDQMENFKNVDPSDGSTCLRSGPPLHRAVAVGHRRHRGQHRRLQGRHQHLGDLLRSAGRAEGQDQRRARNERRHASPPSSMSAASRAPATRKC